MEEACPTVRLYSVALKLYVYKSACIAQAYIRDFFYVIFQTVDESCLYVDVIFVQSGEIPLLGVASE